MQEHRMRKKRWRSDSTSHDIEDIDDAFSKKTELSYTWHATADVLDENFRAHIISIW